MTFAEDWAQRAADFHRRHRRAVNGGLVALGVGFSALAFGIAPMAPDPADLPPGCAFSPRCPFADELCARVAPPGHRFEDETIAGTEPHFCECHHVHAIAHVGASSNGGIDRGGAA